MDFFLILADGPGFTGFLTNFNTMFWSGVLRIAEAMVGAAPFLVAGVLAAGILRGMFGADVIRKVLGVGHWSGPLRAWVLGITLPICSLGALPVARELRRAGVPSGTVLSFVLVAPVLNPVSIIYGLSHVEPMMLVYFAVGTLVVSLGIGMIWNHFISDQKDVLPEKIESAPRDSMARLAVVGDTAARSLIGPVFIDYMLALLAVGFLGAFLPHGILQTGMTRDNPLAPVIMGMIAIPVYVTPTDVMMHFGHIVRDGFSLGAAFALILLGAGANLGVANWLRRDYGFKPLMLFVGLLIGTTLAIGFTADRTIHNGIATAKDHTHAFDSFTRLASVKPDNANLIWIWQKVTSSLRPDEIYGLGILGVFIIAGIVLRMLGDRVSVEHYLQKEEETSEELTTPGWNPALSTRQIIIANVVCAISLGIFSLYLFYPPQEDLLADMNLISVNTYEAVQKENLKETRRRLAQWRSHLEKLPVSRLIRTGSASKEQRESVDEVLYSLKKIERYVAAEQFEEAKILIRYVQREYYKCRDLFRNT